MRFDLKIIASWIEPGSRVLDLGCGQGDLLMRLRDEKGVKGTGIEIREEKVLACVAKGLSVVQGDISREIEDYQDQSFDYVILSQTLQQVYDPGGLIKSMLRVGKKGVVSFPNFSHWRTRVQLLLCGRAPVTPELPYEWYDTPNIRVITIKDFERFCRSCGVEALKRAAISTHHHQSDGKVLKLWPNLRAVYGIFLLASLPRDRG